MSEKIIGVTVGTPTSPSKIENEIKPVKTVNGQTPDENGNIDVNAGAFDTETWFFTLADGRSVKKRICIIKPTFNVVSYSDIRTYQFEDDMTWGEWLDSTYNDGAFYWDAEYSCIRPSDNEWQGIWTPNHANTVQLSDKIVAGTNYVIDAVM